jgi:hypothetical protein
LDGKELNDYSFINSDLIKLLLQEKYNIYKLINNFKSEFLNYKVDKSEENQLDIKAKIELAKIINLVSNYNFC